MKFNMRISIKRKLVLFSWSLLLIPIILTGIISHYTTSKEMTKLIEKDLESSVKMAVQIASLLDDSVTDGHRTREEAEELMKQTLLGPKNADGTRQINSDIDLGENGYFFVIDTEGTLLAHPNKENENLWVDQDENGHYYIQELIEKGMNGGGFTYYNFKLPNSDHSAMKVTYSYYMPEWGWIIAGGSYLQDYNGGQKNATSTLLIVIISLATFGGLLAYLVSLRISKPITAMTRQASQIAEGNLSLPPLKVRNKDEIGELAGHFHKMTETLRKLVGETKQMADHVNDSVHQLQTSLSDTTRSAEKIGKDMNEFSSGVQQQAAGTEQSAHTMVELSNGVQQIAEMSSISFEAADTMSKDAQQGQKMITQSIQQMGNLRDSFRSIVETVQQLIQYSTNIEEINNNIKEIAAQTQLLALNASIEAARAGEDGQGFNVVATEIRKLADQSTGFSQDITELVQTLSESFSEVNEAVRTGEQDVESSETVIRQTGDVFQQILSSSQTVLSKIEETSAATEQMSSGTQEVTAAIQEISQLAASFSDRAASISAETQQSIASMEQVRLKLKGLTEQAEKLNHHVQQFKV